MTDRVLGTYKGQSMRMAFGDWPRNNVGFLLLLYKTSDIYEYRSATM